MSDWSRRRALQALGSAVVVSLAGCSSEDSFEESSAESREPVTAYDVVKAREPEGGALFWRGERSEGEQGQHWGHAYVAGEADADEVSFVEGSEAAAELASFVAETDLASSSVLLEAREVRECYDLRLRGVWRDGNGLETQYCSSLRAADVSCSTDGRDTVGVAVRVPFSLADASGFGSGWSSGCDPQPVGVGAGGESGGGGE
ncbi:MAG: hypothetical protein ABEH83_07925 [Halobacterium sp.]